MKHLKFIIATILLLMMLGEKLVFFSQEPTLQTAFLPRLELITLTVVFLLGIGLYIHQFAREKNQVATRVTAKPRRWTAMLLLGLVSLIVAFSFFLNFSKKALDWDDVALYDARAKFLVSGLKLSQMEQLSQFDFKNSYYYLLYPPFTSEVHAIWYSVPNHPPISVLYACFLLLLAAGVFAFAEPEIGSVGALVVTLLTISQESLFSTSLVAYTNLPYTLYLSLGILLLYSYLLRRKGWEFIFGVLLVSMSQSVRFLEPSWLAILLAFSFASVHIFPIRKTVTLVSIFGFLCLLQYETWEFFIHAVSQNTTIFQMSFLNFFEPVVGFFTGSFFWILVYLCLTWGLPLVIHFSALVTIPNYKDKFENKADLFFKLTIIFSFLMYFAGLYFISFQVDWWGELGGSLIRSSTFLFPVSLYLIIKEVRSTLNK